ncbi:hypothetical protein J6590_013017 [Homalodisca vitripennis]|nr:hypothetical protein J6590_013017 [Homalodisca vitripennis]
MCDLQAVAVLYFLWARRTDRPGHMFTEWLGVFRKGSRARARSLVYGYVRGPLATHPRHAHLWSYRCSFRSLR